MRTNTISPILAVAAVLLTANSGCASNASSDVTTPEGSATTPSTGTSSPSGTSSAAASNELPNGDACQTSADCEYGYTYLMDGKCCRGTCTPHALSKDAAHLVEAECERRGWEADQCPTMKCVAPPPLACRDNHCVIEEKKEPAKTGAVGSKEDAISRALGPANEALDKAYAAFGKKPGVVAPAHTGPWASADNATVEGPNAAGYRVKWAVMRPAGFEFRATATVSKDGAVKVEESEASFSPD